MYEDLPSGATPARHALRSLMTEMPARAPARVNTTERASIFDLYPRGSDTEVLGALRFLIEVEGIPAAALGARAGLDAGAVDAVLAGREQLSTDALCHLCRSLKISRWLLFLIGSVKYGADLGLPELQWLIEERRQMQAGAAGGSLVELVAEATRLHFRLGTKSY